MRAPKGTESVSRLPHAPPHANFNVKLIYSIQVLGPWLWGNRPFFSSLVGQRKGPCGANAPPIQGIKKCLDPKSIVINTL
jgi:hypothetical protein